MSKKPIKNDIGIIQIQLNIESIYSRDIVWIALLSIFAQAAGSCSNSIDNTSYGVYMAIWSFKSGVYYTNGLVEGHPEPIGPKLLAWL